MSQEVTTLASRHLPVLSKDQLVMVTPSMGATECLAQVLTGQMGKSTVPAMGFNLG